MLAMRILVCALCALAAAATPLLSANEILALAKVKPEEAFAAWSVAHGKPYKPECKKRAAAFSAFQANVKMVEEQAAANPRATMALNEFADLTWEQFASTRLGLNPDLLANRNDLLAASSARVPGPFMHADAEIKDAVDWRSEGVVSGVKNQGQCGSCWAFSTTGAVEGINAIKTGSLLVLSEQELVDCDTKEDMGCSGGLMDNAYEYIIKNGGIDTDADYEYWSGWGGSFWGCNHRKEVDRHVVTIDGYQDVPENDEEALLKASTMQPISVAICANSLMFYSSGILDACCEGLNHGVLLVGYASAAAADSDNDADRHYIVKNSWGSTWGEKGYFRLAYGGHQKGGLCGIASAASYPVKTSPNPTKLPMMCDQFAWTECAAGAECSCSWSLFGLLCLWHDCCPLEGGVTCDDLAHCCPSDAPVCDTQRGMCVSEDGKTSIAWTDKTPATTAAVTAGEQQQHGSAGDLRAGGFARGGETDKFARGHHEVEAVA
ncbi:hypothetical protein FOA52_007206 [Chlamydomonas sp. UWO 241]|nr:hypothetical protein FOA52_007206 [Chlamydomonas sp. UWO 241]